jgi:DNA modification methylase
MVYYGERTTMNYTLHLGDCLKYMRTMEAGSVDAIITDLPYGTTACKWDTVIEFAPMWKEVKRVMKTNGAFITTASQPFTSVLVCSNLEWFRDEWIWEKDRATRHLDAKRRPLKAHESIVVFGRVLPNYNPQITYGHKPTNKQGDSLGNLKQILIGDLSPSGSGGQTSRYPRSVYKCNVVNGDMRGLHPTQKPVELYRYLIRTYTNEGETILDIAMGSGTTGVAARMEGRNFIGCEIEPDYFAISESRISQAVYQPGLFTASNTTSTGAATPQGKQAELFTTASGQDASG